MIFRNIKALSLCFFTFGILFVASGCERFQIPTSHSTDIQTAGFEIYIFEYESHEKLGEKFG